ncbi:PREDICTED: F-box/LRR-repeat protein 6 [Nicrophorus vespilloides]|uniref:F-box/LRR-repeat protein 6 n=1 Tax=Nicrophorus vespilloides TaxID=110193 RepID=A0ABM1N9T4_NICVS|nr:PREDICTED: F-box/LRR-repeat protein 6 [Nicrophorus vespilloides]
MAEQSVCDGESHLAYSTTAYNDSNGVSKHQILPNNNVCTNLTEYYNPHPGNFDGNDSESKDDSQDSIESAMSATSQNSDFTGQDQSQEPGTSPKESATCVKTDRLVLCNPVVDYNNGAIGKSNKVGKGKKTGTSAGRGRPRKALVPMYQSQISGDKNTIKIRIKKSNLSTHVQLTPNKKKTGRRKKQKTSDTDTSDHESTSKRYKNNSNDADLDEEPFEPAEQSVWGSSLPRHILHSVFQHLTIERGALPTLVRLCKVCKLWREVASEPTLWRKVDLNWVRERYRTDIKLHWLIENRLSHCVDLNMGEWKVRNIQTSLESIKAACPRIKGLNLSGWKGLSADNLKYITMEYENLQRIDLSSINSTTAINALPLVNLGQTMNSRLTHLVLAHNKIAGFSQIMASIAGNCSNLELLDISNIRTFAHNTALLHVEKLQTGCTKLRVLRITNSQIWLAPASLSDQVASPGFPELEELSLAGIEEDKTTTARCVDDEGIERILKNARKLRLLDVRGCIRLTDSGLVKVPAWDLTHLFLSACFITRAHDSGLELILQKWSHSLLEVDLAWSTATSSLDAAVLALAEKGAESPLRTINLCGSSVNLEPVKAVLSKCPSLNHINLQSCRALPRGIKRMYHGDSIQELKQALKDKPKTENSESDGEVNADQTTN